MNSLKNKTVKDFQAGWKGHVQSRLENLKHKNTNSYTDKDLLGLKGLLIVRGGTPSIPLICHDDSLVCRGQKNEVGLNAQWRAHMHKTGPVLRYFNPNTRQSIAPIGPIPPGFTEERARERKLEADVFVYAAGSYIDIRRNDLYPDIRSRYRLLLEALKRAFSAGIIRYRGKGNTLRSAHSCQEALRHRLNTVWSVVQYEHNLLLLDCEIGQTLLSELKPFDISGHPEWDTVYLRGFTARTRPRPTKVLIYDMLQKHGYPFIKIEVTLRSYYLKSRNLRRADQFREQPDIQGIIENELRKHWCNILKKAPNATDMLMDHTGCSTPQEILDYLADRSNTLTSIRRRI